MGLLLWEPVLLAKNLSKGISHKKEYEHLGYVMAQSHAIYKEIWRLLTQKQVSPFRSIFGKSQRAFLLAQKNKVSQKIFSCEKFTITFDKKKGKIEEVCTRNKKIVMEWYQIHPQKFHFSFLGENHVDVLGIGTSTLNPKIECEVTVDRSNKIQRLFCSKYMQDKTATEIYEMEHLEYQKENQQMITLKGHLLVNLIKDKKIEMKIPIQGKIEIVETQIEPPPLMESSGEPPVQSKDSQKNTPLSPTKSQSELPEAPHSAATEQEGVPQQPSSMDPMMEPSQEESQQPSEPLQEESQPELPQPKEIEDAPIR